ncbi:MAG TPA: M28 family peptidase [Caulobacteraceae bacterium]|nr:M28 family peptidase [Caulobacteraceae bacterium]
MRAVLLASLLALGACSTAPAPASAEAEQVAFDGDPLIDDVRILADDTMKGRAPGTPGSRMARSYIEFRFEEIGVEPIGDSYEQRFVFTAGGEGRQGVNIIGRIDGTSRSRKVMVITAHYDHLGVVNGEIYNGADDNASGVAGLLAIAQAFVDEPPRHDIILAAVDAEESGLRGARVLLSDPPVPLSQVALNVNLDMLSKSSREELFAAGTSHWPFLRPRLEAIAARAPVTLKIGHDGPGPEPRWDWTMLSDHGAFHEKGIPWVYFGVEDHAESHQPTDVFGTIQEDFFRRSVQTVVQAVRAFDRDLDEIAREAAAR